MNATQITALTAAINALGLKAKEWKGRRIYLNGFGRDISAYIELDEPQAAADPAQLYDGCALKVFSNCEQSPKWRANRAKQIKHQIMLELYHDGDGPAAHLGAPCDNWQDVIL